MIKDSNTIRQNKGRQALGYSPNSGVKIIQASDLAFNDLSKNGKLDVSED